MSDPKPNIDNLPLDLFGDQQAQAQPATEPPLTPPATIASSAPATLTIEPRPSSASSPTAAAPVPAATTTPFGTPPTTVDASTALPRRLLRLYDAAGVLAISA